MREWKAFDAEGWRDAATRPLARLLAKQGHYAEALEEGLFASPT